jgi:hypothetical protein
LTIDFRHKILIKKNKSYRPTGVRRLLTVDRRL